MLPKTVLSAQFLVNALQRKIYCERRGL